MMLIMMMYHLPDYQVLNLIKVDSYNKLLSKIYIETHCQWLSRFFWVLVKYS